jgi:alkyl hydroperoxide reductase subunit AhpC
VKDYGLLDENTGYAARATFVVDEKGLSKTSRRARPQSIRLCHQACSVLIKKK